MLKRKSRENFETFFLHPQKSKLCQQIMIRTTEELWSVHLSIYTLSQQLYW